MAVATASSSAERISSVVFASGWLNSGTCTDDCASQCVAGAPDDLDNDGVLDSVDNCLIAANPQQLDPDLPSLPLAWAQLHASAGEVDQAIAHAQRGVARDPESPEAHLALAGILRAAGRFDEMRQHARQALSFVHPTQRSKTEKLVVAVLGPTALEPVAVDAGAAPPESAPDAAASEAPAALSLDEDLDLADPGRLKLNGDGPRLRLGDPGKRLRLSR